MAVDTMAEHDIDISSHRPKDLETVADRRFDYVITVCERAKETCPVLASAETIHWSFADPTEIRDERKQALAFHELYRGLKRRIDLFMTVASLQSHDA